MLYPYHDTTLYISVDCGYHCDKYVLISGFKGCITLKRCNFEIVIIKKKLY